MGDPSRYVTSHPGQLSLAIPPWLGAMSTSVSWLGMDNRILVVSGLSGRIKGNENYTIAPLRYVTFNLFTVTPPHLK